MINTKDIITKSKKQLKDFTKSTENFGNTFIKIAEKKCITYKHSLSGDYDMWRITRYIFSDILHFNISDQPMEKVNWWIPFVYMKKYECVVTHQKFGFRIYVTADTEAEAKLIAESLECILKKVILSIIPLIEQYAKEALLKGEIIVENRFEELFKPYSYFRKLTLDKKNFIKENQKNLNLYAEILEVKHLEQAAYFCFFSMLEHLCVLFLAYRKIPERKDVGKFSNMKWSEKFKTVFDITQPEFKKVYDDLIGLAKYRRNPAAHGYTNTVFDFYLEGARHKMSCMLSDKDVVIQWHNQENNFNITNSFLELIKKHISTKVIFAYIDAGLNISFMKSALPENDMIANMSDEEIHQYIEYTIQRYDNAANMDW